MQTLFFILCAVVACLLSFIFGILVGIKDCKRRFSIPYGAVGVDNDGYIYS